MNEGFGKQRKSRSSDPGERLRGTLQLSSDRRGRSFFEYDPPSCDKYERHHLNRASFSCGLLTQPEASHGVAPLERPSKVRRAPPTTREHALTLAAALTTKLPDRIEEWTQNGLEAVTEEQRASIESFLAAETQAASEPQTASESLDTVPPLIRSEEVDLNERPSRAPRGRRSLGGFLADTLSSQSRIRRRSESGSFVSPERSSPGKRWSFFRFSTQPGNSPARSDQASLPSSPVREHELNLPKPRKRAVSDGGRRSEPVFSLSPIRTYTSVPPPPELPSGGRRLLTGASKAGLMDQPATGKSQPGTPTMQDMPRVDTTRSKDLPPPWSAPNSPPPARPPWTAPNSPPPRWRGPKSPPNPRPLKTARASALTSSIPSKAPSPGASPRASVLRWSSFREPPAFTTPKTKDGFGKHSGKRASDPPGEAVASPTATRQHQSAPVSPRGKEGKSPWKSGEKARLSEKRKSDESAKGAPPAAARVLSPPPKRTFSHETEDLLWAEQARKKGKPTSPVNTPWGEKRVGRTEERPRWNEPAWNRKHKQKLSPSPKKRYSKVRSASKSPVRMPSAKKSAKRKSNDLEQPLLDADDSFADGRLSNVDGNAGAAELKLLGSALKVAIDAIPGTAAPEIVPPVFPATETVKPLSLCPTTGNPPKAGDAEAWEETVEATFDESKAETEPELDAEPAEESPTPISEQKRIRSPGMQMRPDPRPMTSSGIRYENPLYDVTMTVSSDKMSDVITTAARFERDRALESIEEGAREGRRESAGIGRGGRPTSPAGFRLTAERSVNKPAESAEPGVNKPEASADSAENWLTRKSLTPASSHKALSSNEDTWLFAAEEEVPVAERNATWRQEGLAVTGGKLTVAEWLKQFEPEGSGGEDLELGDEVAQNQVAADNGHKEDANDEGLKLPGLDSVGKEPGSEGKERSSCSLFDGLLMTGPSTRAENDVMEAKGHATPTSEGHVVESLGNEAAEGGKCTLRTEPLVQQERRDAESPQEANGMPAEWTQSEQTPFGEAQESDSPKGVLGEFAGAGARRARAEQGSDSLRCSQDEVMMGSVTWESLIRGKQGYGRGESGSDSVLVQKVGGSRQEDEIGTQNGSGSEEMEGAEGIGGLGEGQQSAFGGEVPDAKAMKELPAFGDEHVRRETEEETPFEAAVPGATAHSHLSEVQDEPENTSQPADETARGGRVAEKEGERARSPVRKVGAGIEEQVAFFESKASVAEGGSPATKQDSAAQNGRPETDLISEASEERAKERARQANGADEDGGKAAETEREDEKNQSGGESEAKTVGEPVSEADGAVRAELGGGTRKVLNGVSLLEGEESWEVMSDSEFGELLEETKIEGGGKVEDFCGIGSSQAKDGAAGKNQSPGEDSEPQGEEAVTSGGESECAVPGGLGQGLQKMFNDEESEAQGREYPMRRGVSAGEDEEMEAEGGSPSNESGMLSNPGLEVVRIVAESGEELPVTAQKPPLQADGPEELPTETEYTESAVAFMQNDYPKLLAKPAGGEGLAAAPVLFRAADIANGNGSGSGGRVAEESMLAVSTEALEAVGGGVSDDHVEGAEQGHVSESQEGQEEEEDDIKSDAATGQGGGQSDVTEAESDDIPMSSYAMQSSWEESDMKHVASEADSPDQEAFPTAPHHAMFRPEPRKPPPHPAIQIAKVGCILANAAVKTGVGMSCITLQQCGVLARVATGLLIDDAKNVTGGLFKFTGRMLGFK